MAKTERTRDLEQRLWNHTRKLGTYCCFEVTIGFNRRAGDIERVDYLTYNNKGEFRCYEIKVSRADFLSNAHQTFVGDYNYLVMPDTLYIELEIEGLLPEGVGVLVKDSQWGNLKSVKRAQKQEVIPEVRDVLVKSMLRSLYRETDKLYKDKDYWLTN